MKRDFGTGEYQAVEVSFTNPGGVQWTHYELSTGVKVRLGAVLAKVYQAVDEKGDYVVNAEGDPLVQARFSVQVVTSAAPEGKVLQ